MWIVDNMLPKFYKFHEWQILTIKSVEQRGDRNKFYSNTHIIMADIIPEDQTDDTLYSRFLVSISTFTFVMCSLNLVIKFSNYFEV